MSLALLAKAEVGSWDQTAWEAPGASGGEVGSTGTRTQVCFGTCGQGSGDA